MQLKLYTKVIFEINTIQEFDAYVKNNLYTDFNKTPDFLVNDIYSIISNPCDSKISFNNKIKSIFSENGKVFSRYQSKYWLNRGYDPNEICDIIKSLQEKNSPRSVEYWIKRGYSIADSVTEVHKLQKKFGDVNKTISPSDLKKRSARCKDYWVNLGYSDDVAIKKVSDFQQKITKSYWETATPEEKQRHVHFGKDNRMYGRSPSANSGVGWSGWYIGSFFRSMHELNYLVNVIERFNLNYKTAESKKYRIPYFDLNNVSKTYCGDYIINDKYYVEIKPKKLQNTAINNIKQKYAIPFCKKNGLKYKVVDCGPISMHQLIEIYKEGKIIFTNNSKNKFYKYLYKKNIVL
jgi:hypothetical protein